MDQIKHFDKGIDRELYIYTLQGGTNIATTSILVGYCYYNAAK